MTRDYTQMSLEDLEALSKSDAIARAEILRRARRGIRKSKRGYRPRRYPLEAVEQRRLASWLDASGLLWCHVPNERASESERLWLAGQGVKSGVPDVLIFTAPPLAIELKSTDPARKATENQKRWLADLLEQGWAVAVCHGADEAITTIEEHYGPDTDTTTEDPAQV